MTRWEHRGTVLAISKQTLNSRVGRTRNYLVAQGGAVLAYIRLCQLSNFSNRSRNQAYGLG